ncbi:TPA: hypothetical protein N0F65_003585 [Lagenidium giganteum]|uniref:Kinesin-like protein n=1 Tax=Lagenidium giganteum TaxID=4803 RepID=A0AAV2Z041_9STRA|nr:TPA: hypothetical protein N0F65_003585 [Lagenidium giganteum]
MAPTGGNVQVVARVRPRRTYETDDVAVLAVERPNVIELRVPLLTHPGGGASGIRMPSSSQTRTPPPTSLLAMRSRQRIERYEFDRVFGPESTNDDLAAYVQPVVDAVVRQEKDRATILTYGQTGTGKTYTMLGPMGTSLSTVGDDRPRRWSSNQTATVGQPGVMVKVIERLLAATSRHGGGMAISCSYLEVYNNKLYDLLAKPASDTVRKTHTTLEIREDGEHQLHVLGLRRVPTRSMDDFLALLLQGVQQRAQRATDMNEQSSRSHTILQIHVQFAGTSAVPRSAKICLVDLAGSEKLKKAPQLAAVMRNPAVASGVTSLPSDHMKEFALINQSLSHLGQCIQALLADGCSTKGASKAALHVPFRNCKLTRLLRDSFVSTENAATAGGAAEKQGTGKHHDCRQHRSVVVFILTLAPGLSAMGDSLMTLDFANRIKQIRFTTFGPEQPQPSAPSRPQPKLSRSFSMSMDGRMREAEAATLWRYIHQVR